MNDMLNPYIAGAPVVEADMFFGRKDVFGWIERSLMGKYVDHILVIHGQRRVGKTSILKQIPNFLPDRYLQVFLDLQGRTNTTLDRFLWWLAREITRTLKGRHGLTISTPDRGAFAEDPEMVFTLFLTEVQSVLGEGMLLLTFDEFDTLEQPSIQEKLAQPLIQMLRRMLEMEGFSFIFSIGSSGQKLENMQAAYTDFFKSALYKKISFLDVEDCSQLITNPVEGVLEYEQGAIQRIYEITAGHPYFTQLVCHELFSVCQKTGARVIQLPDVDAVLVSVIERGTVNLKFIWDEADDLEKWVLAYLARSPECSDPTVLAQTLRSQRVRFSEHDLNAALVHMREKDVLTENNQFLIELLRLWLRQNRPVERVREELVEISPIANRYVEIGEEYWEQGQRENALESFQQALEVDPENVQARVSIGALLLEAAEYKAAASAFENALALDGENIAAMGGYCKAQLALGEWARDEGELDQAIEFFQTVLTINPEHRAAREQLGSLYHQQAEAKLSAGQDEAALLAFQTALGYSPEDEDMTKRVQQVMEKKQAKAIAALRARSDDAQAKGDWEAAIAALQDALALAGRDQALDKKLEGVKAGQRDYLLATLPEQARMQEKVEAWEDAITTWQSYLALYPEDQEAAAAALENAQKMRVIQVKYNQTQDALQKKDFYRAIELLRQIVQVDPEYKDASRLLANAVRSSRGGKLNLLRRSWLPILSILIIVGAYFGLSSGIKLSSIALQRATATLTYTAGVAVVNNTPFATEAIHVQAWTEPATAVVVEVNNTPFATEVIPIATRTELATAEETATATQTSTPIHKPSETPVPGKLEGEFVDGCGVQMVWIPAGSFLMGREGGHSDEYPIHNVWLDAFAIDIYEVTNELYKKCVSAGVCDPPDGGYFSDAQYDDHPVVGVSWYDAQGYCEWRGARLPSEAEWEKAASGGLEGKQYPWGDRAPVCEKGTANGAKFYDIVGCNNIGTEEVGSYTSNGYELFDMAGNAREWVADWYDTDYYGDSLYENPPGPALGTDKVLRGGGWYSSLVNLRSANRSYGSPDDSYYDVGFRCVSGAVPGK